MWALNYLTFMTAYWLQHPLAVETPTVSLRKFTEQSGQKSHNKENQTSVCDEWTLSFWIYVVPKFSPVSFRTTCIGWCHISYDLARSHKISLRMMGGISIPWSRSRVGCLILVNFNGLLKIDLNPPLHSIPSVLSQDCRICILTWWPIAVSLDDLQ